MSQKLIIMQGVPGSGKTTTAMSLAEEYNALVYSTDDFFMTEDGYKFVFDDLKKNHQKNIDRVKNALSKGISVIIDNTNISAWETKPYVEYAIGIECIEIIFVRCDGCFKNTHGVPENIVNGMRERMQNLTIDIVMSSVIPDFAK